MTYGTLISTQTIGAGGATTIVLGSGGTIPQTYTDLLVVLSTGSTANTFDNITINFNGITTSTYSNRDLSGNGATASSSGNTSITAMYGSKTNANGTTNTFSNIAVYIPNYAGATNKAVSIDTVTEANATQAFQILTAGLWASTAAITSITFTNTSNSFPQYSTASLYGIK